MLLLALRRIAEARGGMAQLARQTGLAREALYRTLSKGGNPRLTSLRAILRASALRLKFKKFASRPFSDDTGAELRARLLQGEHDGRGTKAAERPENIRETLSALAATAAMVAAAVNFLDDLALAGGRQR